MSKTSAQLVRAALVTALRKAMRGEEKPLATEYTEDLCNRVIRKLGLVGYAAQGGDGEHVEIWDTVGDRGCPECRVHLSNGKVT